MLLQFDLYQYDPIREFAKETIHKLKQMKKVEFCGNGWFEVAGTIAVILKLFFAFNDLDWD